MPTRNLRAVFTIPDADNSFQKLFSPEMADVSSAYKSGRANVSYKKKKTDIIITIDATDAIALRAMVNGITKLLAIEHKMGNVN